MYLPNRFPWQTSRIRLQCPDGKKGPDGICLANMADRTIF